MVSKKENVTEFANTIIINERNFLVRVIYKLYSFIYPHFTVSLHCTHCCVCQLFN